MKNLKNVEFIPKNGKNCLRYIVKVEGNQYIITDWMYDIIEMIFCNFDTGIISEHIKKKYNTAISAKRIENYIIPLLVHIKILNHSKLDINNVSYQLNSLDRFSTLHNMLQLKLKVKAFRPELAFKIAQCFTPLYKPFLIRVISFFTLILTTICLFQLFSSGLLVNPERMFLAIASALPLSIVFNILAAALHEFGHAAAAIKSNCKVGEIGIGIYLFSPVMYTQLDSANLISRHKRFIINFGGIYIEFYFINFLILISWLSQSDVYLLLAANQFFACIRNLNPFTKLDGYWLLSDWLEIPNLHKRIEFAFHEYIATKKIPKKPEGKVLLFFIILAICYTLAIISFFIIVLPRYLIEYPLLVSKYCNLLFTGFKNFDIASIFIGTWFLFIMFVPIVGISYLLIRLGKTLSTFFTIILPCSKNQKKNF